MKSTSTKLKIIDSREEALAEKRADIRSAIALRDAILKFNGEARDRNELTLPDRRDLGQIADLLDRFESDSRWAASGDMDRPADTGLSSKAADVINPVRRYLTTTQGLMTVEVAGEKMQIPAIESQAFRAKAYADGQALVEIITGYIDHVHGREQRRAEQWREEFESFAAAMQFPAIAAMVTAWDAIEKTLGPNGGLLQSVLGRVADDIATLTGIYRHKQPGFSTRPRELRKLVDAWNSNQSENNAA